MNNRKKTNKNANKIQTNQKSWIVHFWSNVFGFLSYVSTFWVLGKLAPKFVKTYNFVDSYVTFNTVLSILTLFVVTTFPNVSDRIFILILVIYGSIRTFEVIVYQINILIFNGYRIKLKGGSHAIRGYRRIVILLLHNYVEIVSWFGVVYIWFYWAGDFSFSNQGTTPTFLMAFHESVTLMFSFSPNQYLPQSDVAFALLTIQATIGVFMTLLVFARFLSLLPKPETMDELESDPE